ncbi:MAG: RraA family protein [Pleurocapsa minor GSE-CHR-MK-17-07R]|jgi:regulator of RNase E activity RraA|nr:RraA family protein [Pleurocapsa minor GSE-CHR-MK 17-07R]
MGNATDFQQIPTTTLCDVMPNRAQVMTHEIRPLWSGMPRLAGPAYTVRCGPGDNLMLHAAIYRAPRGSVIVVESADCDYAVAGGNVCAVAQAHGIVGFVIDGVIRDLPEIRDLAFAVFARGVVPIPGGKSALDLLNQPVSCGGVRVSPGDIVVADENGVVVVPAALADDVLMKSQARLVRDAEITLAQWEADHKSRIDQILSSKGFKS